MAGCRFDQVDPVHILPDSFEPHHRPLLVELLVQGIFSVYVRKPVYDLLREVGLPEKPVAGPHLIHVNVGVIGDRTEHKLDRHRFRKAFRRQAKEGDDLSGDAHLPVQERGPVHVLQGDIFG